MFSSGNLVEYEYSDENFHVRNDVKDVFNKDGAFIMRNFLNEQELEYTWKTLNYSGPKDTLLHHAWDLPDDEGRSSRLVIWSHPGNDFTGILARSEKVVNTCEELLEGEVYHYHTKIMMKEAKTGGKHLWHQDYGYWYKNGNLRPDMMTVFIALDPCNKENGGLQIIKGSHLCGRIDHYLVHGQTVADNERIEEIKKQFQHHYVDLRPGDALFFHCNILHTSDANNSNKRRYACLFSYNRADNDPVYKHHHPNYTPIKKVRNGDILKCNNFDDFSGKEIMDPTSDKTVKAKLIETNFH